MGVQAEWRPVCTNEGQAIVEQCVCVSLGIGLSKGSGCANRGQGEVKVQLVLMGGIRGRAVGEPECVLMMVRAVEGSERGQKQSGQGSTRFTLC